MKVAPALLAFALVVPLPKTIAAVEGPANAFTGAWTLNKDLSDQPQNPRADTPGDNDGTERGRRGGGFGRGGGGGGFGGGAGAFDPQQAERMRTAMRDVTNPPDHLTVVSTGTMMILTGPDGRTVRLSPDGKKIKDESTNIERKTKWDGAKLVSEITGLGGGKITETYSVDSEHHQLRIAAEIEGGRGGAARTITHVYDLDAR